MSNIIKIAAIGGWGRRNQGWVSLLLSKGSQHTPSLPVNPCIKNKCFIVVELDRLRAKLHICVHISTLNKNSLQQTKQPNSIPIRDTLSVKPVKSYLPYIRCSLKKSFSTNWIPISSTYSGDSDRPHIFFGN